MSKPFEAITENLDIWSAAIRNKSAAGRGNSKKTELYGIKKLRELILELAVRGLLVAQDPHDEPATSLLSHNSNINERSAKRYAISPNEYNDKSDHPSNLPLQWLSAPLGEVSDTIRGITFPASEKQKFPEAGRIACLRTTNVQDNIEWDDLLYIREQFVSRPEQFIRKHDIVISMANSRELVGKVAMIETAPTERVTFGGFLAVIRANGINPHFLKLSLRTPESRRKLIAGANQTTNIANISLGKLYNLELKIPPVREQGRIVAKVDELMSLCDQLEQQQESSIKAHETLVQTLLTALTNAGEKGDFDSAWSRISENFDLLFTTEDSIDQLKATILQLAVMGKIVRQDPNDEPADKFLIRCREEKISKGKKSNKPPIQDGLKPYSLPAGWTWSKFQDLGELNRGRSKHRPRNHPELYIGGKIPLVQTGDVSRADPYVKTYTALYNEVGLAQSRLWPKGTLCITIAANIAETGLLAFDACFPDSIVGFIPVKEDLNIKYFEFFMRTAQQRLADFAPATAQKNINLEILNELSIPLPPIPEMHRIVTMIEDLMSRCDQLKYQINISKITGTCFADSVCTKIVKVGAI
jgi:type I restriction enzyme S subunit